MCCFLGDEDLCLISFVVKEGVKCKLGIVRCLLFVHNGVRCDTRTCMCGCLVIAVVIVIVDDAGGGWWWCTFQSFCSRHIFLDSGNTAWVYQSGDDTKRERVCGICICCVWFQIYVRCWVCALLASLLGLVGYRCLSRCVWRGGCVEKAGRERDGGRGGRRGERTIFNQLSVTMMEPPGTTVVFCCVGYIYVCVGSCAGGDDGG